MYLAAFDIDQFYMPVYRDILNKDVFVNRRHLMLFDYSLGVVEYINFLGNTSFFRGIWPPMQLEPVSFINNITIVHDFVVMKVKDKLSEFVNIQITNENPVIITKFNITNINKYFGIYLLVGDITMMAFGMSLNDTIICVVKSNIMRYQLNFYKNDFLDVEQQKKNIEFPLNLVLFSIDQNKMLHRFKIQIPPEYNIQRKTQSVSKYLQKKKKFINLTELFKGSIYFFDFRTKDPKSTFFHK
jgi:hypothetical protein